MITLSGFQRLLIYCFVFFGPLGSLLTPAFLPYAFRFYYFFLLFTPIFFINLKTSEWKTVLTFIPFLGYCLFSAYFTHNKEFHRDAYPLFRCFLFVSQCLFMFGAAFCLKDRDEKKRLIRLYLGGFCLSLFVGYLFHIGFYTGKISFETIQRYSIEAQMGWNLLRFSPGTYPNEYGNVASFVLSILLLIYAKKRNFWLFSLAGFTFVAFLLTTTRAAYLSFVTTLIYLCFISPQIRKLTAQFSIFCLTILLLLKAFSIDFFQIFVLSVKTISFTYGSTGVRLDQWVKSFKAFNENIFFGNGFGADILIHNVYLELFFELGLIGFLIFSITLIYYFSENSHRLHAIKDPMIVVGLIHIFLFAITNHNMHQHMTWFVFLLFNMSLFGVQKGDGALSWSRRQPSPGFSPQQDLAPQE